MYRVSLYTSRILRALTNALLSAYASANNGTDNALAKAKAQRSQAAAIRLSAAKDAAESAKARLTVEVDRFKEEAKLVKEMI